MEWWELTYEGGEIQILLPEDIPATLYWRVDAAQRAFKEKLAAQRIYVEGDIPQCDRALFEKFAPYYRLLGKLLGINVDTLTPQSRHAFFVCTDPIEFKEQLIPGLSGLDLLLGRELSESEPKEEDVEGESAMGREELEAALLLSFKRHAIWIFRNRSYRQACKIARHAQEMFAEAREAAKNDKQPNSPPPIDRGAGERVELPDELPDIPLEALDADLPDR